MPKHTSGMCTASDNACICRASNRYCWSTGPKPPLAAAISTLTPASLAALVELRVGDPGEVALGHQDLPAVRTIEIGQVDRATQVSHEHAPADRIESDADALHQVGRQDLGLPAPVRRVQRGPIHGIAARRVPPVGPVQRASCQVELDIDRLGQVFEQHLDVAASGRVIAGGHIDAGPQDLPESGVTRALLGPVEVPTGDVHADTDAPLRLVAAVVTLPGLHQCLDIRAVEVAAHDPHTFAVTPVELPAHRLEMQLL